MAAPQNPKTQKTELALTLTAPELAQLEAFAALHGQSIAAFAQRVALEAASAAPPKTNSAKSRESDTGALWLTEDFSGAPEARDKLSPFTVADAPVNAQKELESVGSGAASVKRGVAGERSNLAKGHGPVWEVRRALGRERVHGLGWTREQLAFVLKLSVVGVRKMEHLGTSPVKSLEARQKLLGLAKTLAQPGAEIAAYIEREEAVLG